ncbi:MAG: hypothetical protein ABFS14_05485 [Gemmatimonadota bacterium]
MRGSRLEASRAAGWLALLVAAALSACGGSRAPFPLGPEPIAYADTFPILEPAERELPEAPTIIRGAFGGEVSRVISPRSWLGTGHEALNVTRLDDVVNSAWFEQRNGRDQMTPNEVWRGASTVTGPDTSRIIEVIAGKAQGISPGFTVRDARGDRYLFKFDPQGFLHLSSAAAVIANRLFYAAGYHTPEDYIVVFDRDRLRLREGSRITMADHNKRPMTDDDISAVLDLVDPLPDGRYLAVASKFVPGIPKGPFYFEGVRGDDPNDYYHHEFRRELRGLYVVSSWLNHVDMRFANTLDAYVQPGYLRHYLIDFAASLGSGTIRPHNAREGMEYNFDFWPWVGRIVTLGFYSMGWEGSEQQLLDPSLGWLPVEDFDPEDWKANWPNGAFVSATLRDKYWGAKLVASFTDEQIVAAVSAGRLPTQAAADTLAKIIQHRRDKIVRQWYGSVTPIERVELVAAESGAVQISFDDLAIQEKIPGADDAEYVWEFEHRDEGRSGQGTARAVPGQVSQTISLTGLRALNAESGSGSASAEASSIARLKVTVRRAAGATGQPATVHLLWDGSQYTIAGLQH